MGLFLFVAALYKFCHEEEVVCDIHRLDETRLQIRDKLYDPPLEAGGEDLGCNFDGARLERLMER